MKNCVRIVFSLILTTAMFLAFAACTRQPEELTPPQLTILSLQEDTDENGTSAYSYQASDVAIPSDVEEIRLKGMRDGKLYFSIAELRNEENGGYEGGRFIRTDMDGNLTAELFFDCRDLRKSSGKDDDAKMILYGVEVDNNGNLCVLAYEADDKSGIPPVTVFRLDETGDLKQTIEDIGVSQLSVCFDAKGSIYLSSGFAFDKATYTRIVKIVEPDGYTYDLYDNKASYNSVLRNMADGQVALVKLSTPDKQGNVEITLRFIDAEKKDWGDSLELNMSGFKGQDVFTFDGFGRHDVCFADYTNFYGYDMETDEIEVLFNWEEIGISTDRLFSGIQTDGDNIALAHY